MSPLRLRMASTSCCEAACVRRVGYRKRGFGLMLKGLSWRPKKPKRELDNSFSISPNPRDRKSTRLNSSHTVISYAVFCLKKKNQTAARIANNHGKALADP